MATYGLCVPYFWSWVISDFFVIIFFCCCNFHSAISPRLLKFSHNCCNFIDCFLFQGHHGHLCSRNCVVDSRWICKVTDYALHTSAVHARAANKPAEVSADKLLWTAPEFLTSSKTLHGTKAGDVYSFSVIIQEVITQDRPFCMVDCEPEEIIQRIANGDVTIRPKIPQGRC